jgi:hypothetical protein
MVGMEYILLELEKLDKRMEYMVLELVSRVK